MNLTNTQRIIIIIVFLIIMVYLYNYYYQSNMFPGYKYGYEYLEQGEANPV